MCIQQVVYDLIRATSKLTESKDEIEVSDVISTLNQAIVELEEAIDNYYG